MADIPQGEAFHFALDVDGMDGVVNLDLPKSGGVNVEGSLQVPKLDNLEIAVTFNMSESDGTALSLPQHASLIIIFNPDPIPDLDPGHISQHQ